MAKALARFTITPSADGYELRIEDDSGEALELLATYEQLDLIAEEIDGQLNVIADEVEEADGEDADDEDE